MNVSAAAINLTDLIPDRVIQEPKPKPNWANPFGVTFDMPLETTYYIVDESGKPTGYGWRWKPNPNAPLPQGEGSEKPI